MVKIDLNADLGEGSNADAVLMTLVSSVNIACGFHAGDAQTMLASVRNAMNNAIHFDISSEMKEPPKPNSSAIINRP